MSRSQDESFEARAQRMMELARERGDEKVDEERSRALALEALGAEDAEAKREGHIAYCARLLVQATLPHSDPGDGVTEYERSNGLVRVHIQAPKKFGLPFGTYPRLLLSWMTTEAVRTKSPELVMGHSLREFMGKLGIGTSGKDIARLREHMTRLFTATVSATYQEDGRLKNKGFRPVEGFDLLWDHRSPNQTSLWQSSLKLNQTFFEEIIRRPVPVNLGALRQLAKTRSPLALDLYAWLTYRMSYLREATTVPWEGLALQFGGDYTRTRDFKAKLVKQLAAVSSVYPKAKFEPTVDGLKLYPSLPHVRVIDGGGRLGRKRRR
jgi:hypothetical protein